MKWNPRIWNRKAHRWAAILIAMPFLLVLVTGLLLQVKKQSSWVQPPTQRGQGKSPSISWPAILDAARAHPEAGIQSWDDVQRLDVQPSRGIAKVISKTQWEVQIDLETGQVHQVAYRRSDVIESLHDGSWFGDWAKLWVFLPVAIIMLGVWLTGVYLFFLPIAVRWQSKRRRVNYVR